MVPPESFALEAYTVIYATTDGADGMICYDQGYKDYVGGIEDRIELLEDARCRARYDEVQQEGADKIADATKRAAAERAITYMGLKPGMPIKDIAVDAVFIGSCTNGRIDDLRQAAAIMKGHHKAENIHRVLVVPASSRVRLQAEKEGLDKVFKDFGAEWRNAGCSMCLGMNPDKLVPNERSISTSNRNFEGRQGKGSRTHLASPAVAAATAIRGTISSPADL